MGSSIWFKRRLLSTLHLKLGKCKLVLYNTETGIYFRDGTTVPKATSVVYLGALIHEVTKKIRDAQQVFKTLMRVWKHTRIAIKRKLSIYYAYACVVSKLMYMQFVHTLLDGEATNAP